MIFAHNANALIHNHNSLLTAAACLRSWWRHDRSGILSVSESMQLYSMHCVTARAAHADASFAGGGQQTATQKGLIAAWHCLPGTSTWLSILV